MRKILLQAFIVLIAAVVNCRAQQIKFNLVESPNTGPLGNITAITQDPAGYMWFSGQQKNCLYRYDGVKMIAFRHDSLDQNSLGVNNLETVYADAKGVIWIGSFEGGLDEYNPLTNKFRHYKNDPHDSSSLARGMVSAILMDHQGRLWVGTATGLDMLDKKTNRFIHYRNKTGDSTSLSNNFVRAIYEDSKGILWIGTGFEFDHEHPNDGGLNRMEANGTFTRFLHDSKNPHSLINNKVRCIFEDSYGTFWVGTQGDGLHTMDREKGTFERHLFNPSQPYNLSRPALYKEWWVDPITFIKEDDSRGIWIGTYKSGINRYDPITGKVTHFESSNGFPDKSGWTAYKSRDGVLWLSVGEKNPDLFTINSPSHSIKNIITGDLVRCFYEDKDQFVWVSHDEKGMFQFDKTYKLIRKYKPFDAADSSTLFKNNINAIFDDQKDSLWIETDNGLYIYDKLRRHYGRFIAKSNKNFTDGKIYHLNKDSFRIIHNDHGVLIKYDPKTNSVQQFHLNKQDSASFASVQAVCVMEDKSGDVWVGTFRGGLYRLNKKSGHLKHYLKGSIINCLYEDVKNNIWAGTEEGLYHYDKENDRFVSFFEPESDMHSVTIRKIIEDNQENLWVITLSAIIKLDSSKTKSFVYGKNYDIRNNSLTGGVYKTVTGEILVGHDKGFYAFYPPDMPSADKPVPIVITDFSINNHSIFPGKISGDSLDGKGEITLKYNENNLSFQFAVTDYRDPASNKYYTMLENYDNTWRNASGDKTAFYVNVPPGKYIFHIKAFNIDGIKTEKTISIIIDPPWWKTWWAYMVYGLLLVILVVAVHRFQQQRIIRTERQKAQVKELAQAKEIEKAYHNLRTTQAQLIQSEKMASLGELTAGIAHEIQNPLNFVNNFSEVNTELIDEMQEEMNKGNIEEARSISNDIKENEIKISQHGKRADAIVKGMLQHSQNTSGIKEPTDINALCEEYMRLSYHGMRAKDKTFNAILKTDYDHTIVKINIIPQDTGRVLLNLMNNAFYAVNEKKSAYHAARDNKTEVQATDLNYEPTVLVSTKKIDNKVQIVIHDNGNGIPEKVIDKIFQPFFTTKPAGQGTGLGLSLSYDLIKAQGGEIRVASKEGEGTQFFVILPA